MDFEHVIPSRSMDCHSHGQGTVNFDEVRRLVPTNVQYLGVVTRLP